MTDVEKYIKELEEQGIIDENGAPIKCRECGTSNFKEFYSGNIYYEETHIVCKDCGKVVGSNCNGTWAVI